VPSNITRRHFVGAASAAAAASSAPPAFASGERPAVLGGKPARTGTIPRWPIFDQREEKALIEVVRSGAWNRGRGKKAPEFEEAWAKLTGAKACVTTVNGTNALFTSLNVLGVKAGDEVLVSPFTFVATINVIVRQHALPVFVDTDPETFQLDPRNMEPLVNERTRAIMPVHIGGSAADMDGVLAVARKHKLAVIEDAAQAWTAQWKNRNVGLWGDCGCFSFQASKNINAGEGGAIISNDAGLIERCDSFHNQGRLSRGPAAEFSYHLSGSNLRLTEFQAAVLLVQLTRFQEQQERREANAAYLAGMLRDVPGIRPAKMYDGCTRNAWHLFMIHYDKAQFADMPRAKFLKALNAEGVPFGAGYSSLRNMAFLRGIAQDRAYKAIFPAGRLAKWEKDTFNLPDNDRVCEEHAWCGQAALLADRGTMEQMAEGFRKVQKNAAQIAKA
jgi:perosamine synthetase